MSRERRLDRVETFMPLRRVPRRRLIVRAMIAPFLWLTAFAAAAIVLKRTYAIELGLLIALGAVALSMVVLALLRAGRNHERRRNADSR
jgi:hypothetical protein